MPSVRTLKLALRFSLREMRGGLSGFLIFLTCIALGVAAIGGVNSVARSITAGVAEEGQSLLGGDIRFELNQRQVTDAERAFLESLGTLATSANMRSMGRLEDGSDQALVEAKAVDAAYPLYGALGTEPALPREELFGERSGVFGAAAPDLLFERLGIASQMAAKTHLEQGSTRAAARVVEGRTAVLITLVSEIVPVAGMRLAGALPAEFQGEVTFAAGAGARSSRPDVAAQAIACVTSASTERAYAGVGLERLPAD